MKKYENLKNNFCDVSRETFNKLEQYEASLSEWQQKFNLVSNSSLDDCWNRHFLDSVQLFKYIPEDAKFMYDFGSGAGFPGMVLAIIATEKTPYLKINLIESTKKKTVYLNEVKNITGTKVEIVNQRIENMPPVKADVITSRAMASLNELLEYTQKFFCKKTKCIFLKGRSYAEEISEAKKNWAFDFEVFKSQTSDEGVILIITNLLRLKERK